MFAEVSCGGEVSKQDLPLIIWEGGSTGTLPATPKKNDE